MAIFQKVKFGDIAIVNPESIGKNFKFEEIQYIDISSVGTGVAEKPQVLSAKDAPSRARRLVADGDTILSTVRPNRRSFLFIKNPAENTVVSTGFAVIRSKPVSDSRFVYYLISQQEFTDYLAKNAKGSAYPAVDEKIITDADVYFPNLQTQVRIASVLSAYDDLIENNEKRIKVLEEMASRLYTEWFVKFKFPGHEKVKMVDSGAEFGMIPEGWDVRSVGSLLGKIIRKAKIQTSDYKNNGLFPILDQGKDFIAGYTDDENLVYKEDLVVFGDHTRCFKYCNFPFACGADGTQLLKTNDLERMPELLLYFSVSRAGLENYNYARHFKFLKALNIILPAARVAKSFSTIVSESYEQIKRLQLVNIESAKIRDLLIPQLVTGRREVK